MELLTIQRGTWGNFRQGPIGPGLPRVTAKDTVLRSSPHLLPPSKVSPLPAHHRPANHQPLFPVNPISCSFPPHPPKAQPAKRLTRGQRKRATGRSAPIRAEQGGSSAHQSEPPTAKAAFFDVDGTIAKTNIVWPYVYLRLRELPMLARLFWVPYFSTLSILYRLADKIDRGLLCRLFYFNYRGRPAGAACEWGKFAYEEYMRPR